MIATVQLRNLVDSSAWLEYLAGTSAAEHFAGPIEDTRRLVVPTVCLTEVFKVVLRQRGDDDALQVAAVMQQGDVVALDGPLALAAARLGQLHKLPLADSIVYATALQTGAVLWTQDGDFEGLPSVRYFAKRK